MIGVNLLGRAKMKLSDVNLITPGNISGISAEINRRLGGKFATVTIKRWDGSERNILIQDQFIRAEVVLANQRPLTNSVLLSLVFDLQRFDFETNLDPTIVWSGFNVFTIELQIMSSMVDNPIQKVTFTFNP